MLVAKAPWNGKNHSGEKIDFINVDYTAIKLFALSINISIFRRYLCQARLGNTPPGLLLLKSFEAKLNRKTSKKDEVLSQVRDLIGI